MRKVKTQLVIEGKNDTQKAFAEVNREMSKLSEQMKTTGKLIAGYFSANAITSSVGAVIRTADAYQRMNARLSWQRVISKSSTRHPKSCAVLQTPRQARLIRW